MHHYPSKNKIKNKSTTPIANGKTSRIHLSFFLSLSLSLSRTYNKNIYSIFPLFSLFLSSEFLFQNTVEYLVSQRTLRTSHNYDLCINRRLISSNSFCKLNATFLNSLFVRAPDSSTASRTSSVFFNNRRFSSSLNKLSLRVVS